MQIHFFVLQTNFITFCVTVSSVFYHNFSSSDTTEENDFYGKHSFGQQLFLRNP